MITLLSVLATWWGLSWRFSNAVALLSASVFAISPLFSIRPFLNGMASPAAILFLMIAGVLHVSGRKVSAYLVSSLILLSYEMVFPLFALLPALLKPLRSRGDIYRLIVHGAICVAMVAAYALFKNRYGGSRLDGAVAGQSGIDIGLGIISAVARSVAPGALGSMDLPLWLNRVDPTTGTIAWGVIAIGAFAFVLHRIGPTVPAPGRDGLRLAMQSVAVLALMVLAGYALTYFVARDGAVEVVDRGSRLHTAASLPFSILTGMALVGLLRLARPGWSSYSVIVVEAGFLALMFAYSISHQDDFAAETERQRLLVTQLVIDHPLMDPQATFIIQVPYRDIRHRPSIEYEDSHSLYFLLRDLFDFGQGTGPTLRIVKGDVWQRELTIGPDGRLDWPAGTWPAEADRAGHVWRYEFTAVGQLQALPAPVVIDGRNILHDGPDTAENMVDMARIPRLPLFDKVMGPDAAIINAALDKAKAAQPASSLPAAR